MRITLACALNLLTVEHLKGVEDLVDQNKVAVV